MKEQDDKIFTFVACKGWAKGIDDRGGLQYALKAFTEEFGEDEPVTFKIKINTAYCPQNWNLDNELKKINLKPHKKLIFSLNAIPYNILPKVYTGGDCFVAPTMCEAFGLPIAEAMSCGIPPITTGFGGQTDFVKDKETGLLINYKLKQAPNDFMYEEVQWAEPDIEHLKKLMRYAYEHKEEMKEMGKRARKYCVNNLTWKHSAQKVMDAIKEIE